NVTDAEFRSPTPLRARVPPACRLVPRVIVPVYGLLPLVMVQTPGVAPLSILNRALLPMICPPHEAALPAVSHPSAVVPVPAPANVRLPPPVSRSWACPALTWTAPLYVSVPAPV